MDQASRDPSLRFLGSVDGPLPDNLGALWATDPSLAGQIEREMARRDRDGASPVMVQPSRDGAATLSFRVQGVNGVERTVQLHSRYAPLTEAGKLAHSVDTTGAMLLFVNGLGLGYHVKALLDRIDADATLFVFEPIVPIITAAMETIDIAQPIATGRLVIVTLSDKAALLARLNSYMAGASMPVVKLRHAPSVSLAPQEHALFEQAVDDFLAYAKTCVSTLISNGRRTAENITQNLGRYVSTPGIAHLNGAHRGQPAIIVSAGPSLRKNKHLLSGVADRAVLIAVQTTLQPLLEMGVQPRFVTSLDYHDICTRFFERLPSDLETELVAEPKASPSVLGMYPGRVSLVGNDFAEAMLNEMNLARPKLRAGATVAHLAFYLAEHLGCDPIIFVGQDLGFSDGLCYTPGTSYDDVWRPELSRFCTVEMKQWEQITRDRPILRRVPDLAGRGTYTEERLFTYLQQFERDFAQCPARVIDATEGGVLKRGAETMTLREAIARYCNKPIHAPPAAPHDGEGALSSAIECLRRRKREVETIVDAAAQTLPILEEIRDCIHDQPRVNRAIARIDAIRQRLDATGRAYDLVTQFTQATELRRFQTDRRIAAAAQLSETDRQGQQVLRDIENVRGVFEAATALVERIAMTIDALCMQRGRE